MTRRGPVSTTQVPDDQSRRWAGGQLRGSLDAAKQGSDAGHQLAHPEGLGEVVVGADGQPHQHVGLVVEPGELENRWLEDRQLVGRRARPCGAALWNEWVAELAGLC